MDKKLVKDLMVPIEEYPTIEQDATLLDAILILDRAQNQLSNDRQPHRAVLVVDDRNKIIGKIGQLIFLKALSANQSFPGDLDKLDKLGVKSDSISSLQEHIRFFQENVSDFCRKSRLIKVKDVIHPIAESIDEKATLVEAINKICMLQTLSIPVTRNNEMVGLLRLSDLFTELTKQIKSMQDNCI